MQTMRMNRWLAGRLLSILLTQIVPKWSPPFAGMFIRAVKAIYLKASGIDIVELNKLKINRIIPGRQVIVSGRKTN